MSVRQYIGARYVPRFLGIWNNTTQYEALDVVDNGSGTSYIAKKMVPAGTPLNDTEFWFVYGASSGAIIDLQNRMSIVEGNINDLIDAELPIYTPNTVEGVTDPEDIVDVIENLPEGGQLIFPKATYTLSRELVIDKNCIIDFNGSTIVCDPDMTFDPVPSQLLRKWPFVIDAPCIIKNGTLDCGNGNSYTDFATIRPASIDSEIWGVVIESSNVTLDRFNVINTAVDCILIYNQGIGCINIKNCQMLNSCMGIQIETPAGITGAIYGVNIENCEILCVMAGGGVPGITFKNCHIERPAALGVGAGSNPVFRASINDANVVEGAGCLVESCSIINECDNQPAITVFGVNSASNTGMTPDATFINCMIRSKAFYGINIQSNASFIGCTLLACIAKTVAGAIHLTVENCVVRGGTTNPSSTPSAPAQLFAVIPSNLTGHNYVTLKNNKVIPFFNSEYIVPMSLASDVLGGNTSLISINNEYNASATVTFIRGGMLVGNKCTDDETAPYTTAFTAAIANYTKVVTDYFTPSYS